MHKKHIIYDEHIILQNLEEIGINAYDIIKKSDVFDIPVILEFITIVNNYMNLRKKQNN